MRPLPLLSGLRLSDLLRRLTASSGACLAQVLAIASDGLDPVCAAVLASDGYAALRQSLSATLPMPSSFCIDADVISLSMR